MNETDRALQARHARRRTSLAAGAGAALMLGAVVTMAASPPPTVEPGASAGPEVQGEDHGRHLRRHLRGFDGFAGFAGLRGGFAAGDITITAIDGPSVSLETVDGWRRTITVSDDTTISEGGETIGLGDLEVGDRIRFRQRAEDGTYTVTHLAVVRPKVFGRVTAVGPDSLTLRRPDGSSVTVRVDGSTTYRIAGSDGGGLADITVGMIVVAVGQEDGDGSFDADAVRAGTLRQRLGRDRQPSGGEGPPAPAATPAPGSDTSAG